MPLIAKIAVSAATYAIDKPYDYLLAEDSVAKEGCRVLVPFGRGNRTSEGMILSLQRGVSEKPLKAVRQASLLQKRSSYVLLFRTHIL